MSDFTILCDLIIIRWIIYFMFCYHFRFKLTSIFSLLCLSRYWIWNIISLIKYIVPLIITLLNSLIDCFNPPRCHYCLKSSHSEVIHHLITGVFPLPCCHLNPIIMINQSFMIKARLKPKLLPPYNRSS